MKTDAPAPIRFLRQYRGIRQAALARALGVAQSSISRWENGVCETDADTRVRLLAILAGDPDAPEPPPPKAA